MFVLFEKAMSFHFKCYVEELRLITKILVGVDGSKTSEKALDYALEIADKFSASILILNVFQPPPEFGFGYQEKMLSQYSKGRLNILLKIQSVSSRICLPLSKTFKKCTKPFC